MRGYRCPSCGKLYDPEKIELCPACGAAPAPSIWTGIERKRTAARFRDEERQGSHPHCHEDDAWTGSYGAKTHSAAVQRQEDHYRHAASAHSKQGKTGKKGLGQLLKEHPWLILLFFLLPYLLYAAVLFLLHVITHLNFFLS